MVGSEFLDLFQKISATNRISIEDFADRVNLFTVLIFLLATIVVSAKQYLLNSISCFVPVSPSGENFKGFLSDFCWVHGTIPLRPGEKLPSDAEEWDTYDKIRRQNYYQWVPFMLGLQCIFFYIPHIAWQAICANRAGGDLFALVKSAADAATNNRASRQNEVNRVAEFLQDMIEDHKDCRHGRRAKLSRKAYDTCGIFVAGKRLGTCLVFSYLAVKVVTIINAVLNIYLIQRFLGFHSEGAAGEKSMLLGKDTALPLAYGHAFASSANYPQRGFPVVPAEPKYNTHSGSNDVSGFIFGITVANYILRGMDWPETTLFPRVAYCRVPGIRLVGVENAYTAQCALPINMLNEKIYIFMWFWITFVGIISIVSLFLWLTRLIIAPKRKDFIKRFLRVRNIRNDKGTIMNREDLDDFIDEYLRRDGVFLIRMMALNAGDVITSEVVTKLWLDYSRALNEEKQPLNDMHNVV